jgi:hypothetical protein
VKDGFQVPLDAVKRACHLPRDPYRAEGAEHKPEDHPPDPVIHPNAKKSGHPQRKKDPSAHKPEDSKLRLLGDNQPERIPPLRCFFHDE